MLNLRHMASFTKGKARVHVRSLHNSRIRHDDCGWAPCDAPSSSRRPVARGRVRILSLTSGDPLEAVGGREDGDTLVVAKRVQIGIARDDRLCSCGERARKDVGVIGVA